MFLIVGLGNPGSKYQNNRHNVGHLFIDYLISQLTDSQVNRLKIVKTNCFMNVSGKFVRKLISNFKFPTSSFGLRGTSQISNLIIVHDDLDIPLGKFKIQKATGPLLHNGIESIERELKTKDFWRVRVGVDNRQQTGYVDGETYVLQDFRPDELKIVNELFPKIYLQLIDHLNIRLNIR